MVSCNTHYGRVWPRVGVWLRAFDPDGTEQAKAYVSDVAFCKDAYDCAQRASALVIVIEWGQFRALDPSGCCSLGRPSGVGRTVR